MDDVELTTRFTYHAPVTREQQVKYEKLRAAAKDYAKMVEDLCPESREKSIAMTNIEQSSMWANAAVARRS